MPLYYPFLQVIGNDMTIGDDKDMLQTLALR